MCLDLQINRPNVHITISSEIASFVCVLPKVPLVGWCATAILGGRGNANAGVEVIRTTKGVHITEAAKHTRSISRCCIQCL